jgi:hypothetical protein
MAQTRREREKGMEKENLVPAEFTNNQDGRMTKGPATIVGAEQGDAFRIVTLGLGRSTRCRRQYPAVSRWPWEGGLSKFHVAHVLR